LSQIQEIDIGIQTKVTPLEIDGNKVKMRIETSRAFLADNQIRTLNAALTTFRQQVAATAEVAFGETLILSGLSETAEDQSQSKTPVLGDVPGLNALFNQRSKSKREESVLILVTPSKATTIPSLPFIRAPAVEQLIQLWSKVVDPMSNLSAVVTQLQQTQTFSRMRPEDTAMVWPDPREQAADVARSFDR
jgi:Flp pilus assembly secretin CpaC